jgi:undecaprenyl-diphosphatase
LNETEIIKWIQQHRIEAFDGLFIFLSAYTTYINSALILSIAFWIQKNEKPFFNFSFAGKATLLFVIQALVSRGIKLLVNRTRPFDADNEIIKLSTGGSPSFPSGHTMETAVIVCFLWGLFPNTFFRTVLVCWLLAVAYSRVVLGVHYVSDVLGAMIIGWLLYFLIKRYIPAIVK